MKKLKLKNDEILVLKTVRMDRRSLTGFKWPREGKVTAVDWRNDSICGGGFHALPWGVGNAEYLNLESGRERKLWLVIKVSTDDHNYQFGSGDFLDKCKFRSGTVVYCGTRREAVDLIAKHAPPLSLIVYRDQSSEGDQYAGDRSNQICASNVDQVSGSYSNQTGNAYVTQTTGSRSRQRAGDFCRQTGRDYVKQHAGAGAVQRADDYATQTAGAAAMQSAKIEAVQTAAADSIQRAEVFAVQSATDRAQQVAGRHAVQRAGFRSKQRADAYSVQEAGSNSVQEAGISSKQKGGVGTIQRIRLWTDGKLKIVTRKVTRKEADRWYEFTVDKWIETTEP